jgi:outer membrane protein OmpA-like peptidoglycan-associated protein
VVEKESGQKIGDYNFENGKYSIPLKHGKNYSFGFNVRSGSDAVVADISVPRQCKVHDVYQELDLSESSLLVRNAFFDIKKEAGAVAYSDYITKLDKATVPLYNELTLPVSVALASVPSVTTTISTHTPAVTVATSVVTAAATPTVTAATLTVTTSTTPTVTVSTPTVAITVSTPSELSVNSISFDYDRSNLGGDVAELDKVVNFLKSNKNMKVEISGYTDSKGTDEYNLTLSKRRANAVAAYLASKGISRDRIITTGNGESKPIAANENSDGSDNPEGRAKNRRTEIRVIEWRGFKK